MMMAMFCPRPMAAGLPGPGERLRLEASQLVALLASIPGDDHASRWELANLTLEVMGEAYREALQSSLEERPSQTSRRLKLARWQEATADLVRSINRRRQRLLIGGTFSIYADAQEQVIVTIDGEPMVLAGLSHRDERVLEARIIARFCSFNDCRVLEQQGTEDAPVEVPAGDWLIRQDRPPLYRVGAVLHCRFDTLDDRQRKAAACRDTARELLALRQSLVKAERQGVLVSWPLLGRSRKTTSEGLRLILDDRGTWLTLELPRLAQLPGDDWQLVIETVAGERQGRPTPPLVFDGESLPGLRR